MRRLTELAKGRLPRIAGSLLSAAALVFFVLLVTRTLRADDAKALVSEHWTLILSTTAIYCLAYVPMVMAWVLLCRASGAQAPVATLSRVLLVSQIAKYLPGNVGQFLGRAWLGQANGVALKASARAMALELAGVLAACAILSGIALASGLVAVSEAGNGRSMLLLMTLALSVIAALAGVAIVLARGEKPQQILSPLIGAVLLYIALLLLLAASNILMIFDLSGGVSWFVAGQVAGAFAVSWLAGFVTPGSPAGLGVREVTFYALLAGTVPQDVLVMTALAFRIATVSGDLIAWTIGLLTRPRIAPTELVEAQ